MRFVGILAAGLGNRLRPITGGRPKCMVEIGGETLLEHQVRSLGEAGVQPDEITVISGHDRESVETLAARLRCRSLFNPAYDSANNIVSVQCFTRWILDRHDRPEEVLLVNSDTFAHPGIFRAFVASDLDDAGVVVDDSRALDEESMKVKIHDGLVQSFSKRLPVEAADGEYIGLARLGPNGLVGLTRALSDLIHAGRTDAWYEDAFNETVEAVGIRCISTCGLPWIEIDTPDDYREALAMVGQAV